MRSVSHATAVRHAGPASRLILLPGAYQTLEALGTQGFAEQLSRRELPIELECVDVEMAHLNDRRVLIDLHERVVEPARLAGCPQIWLTGISLGGFIALQYAAAYPGSIDGLCLLAPYLGNRMLLQEIAAAPGLAAWQPGEITEQDDERRIWRYLQQTAGSAPSIFLGFGGDDRFAQGHRLLAAVLPPSSVKSIAGGHDWPVWLELWENFLDTTFHDAG